MKGPREDHGAEATTVRIAEVVAMIDRWAADGEITAEQARRMRAVVVPTREAGLVVEALGYLGAVLVPVALGLVAGNYWTELGVGGRLAVVGASSLLLGVAGAAVPRGASGPVGRLRAVLWLAACAGVFTFLVLLADDPMRWTDEAGLSLAAGGALIAGAGFWLVHRHPVQHITTYAAGLLFAGSLVAQLPHVGMLPALSVWGIGVAWALGAWGGLVRPAQLGRWLGASTAVGGAVAVAGENWGAVLALATVAALVTVAVLLRDTGLLMVALLGVLLILPAVVSLWFPGMVSAAVALLVAGVCLVGAAVILARRRRRRGRPGGAGGVAGQTGRRLPAVSAAVAVLAVTAGIVLTAGL